MVLVHGSTGVFGEGFDCCFNVVTATCLIVKFDSEIVELQLGSFVKDEVTCSIFLVSSPSRALFCAEKNEIMGSSTSKLYTDFA